MLFSCPVRSDSLQPHGLQGTRPPCPSPSPEVCPSSCSLHRWCHSAISSSDAIFSFCPQSLPGIFPMSQLFSSNDQNTGVSVSVLPMSIQGWFPLRLTGWCPCSPRDSQESSPAPQFESINSSALHLLYGPALTTIHDHFEDHNPDYTDLCLQSNVPAFQCTVLVCHNFPAKKQVSSDFMSAVTIQSDFGAQEEGICHYFHLSPVDLTWSNGARYLDLSLFNI